MVTIDPSYRSNVRSEYNQTTEIWDPSDRWHSWARRQIEVEMSAIAAEFEIKHQSRGLVVDVGSGGNSSSLDSVHRIDIDLAERRLSGCQLAVCANVESLPLASQAADLTVCVG